MRIILPLLLLALAALTAQAQTPLPPELKTPAPAASPQPMRGDKGTAARAGGSADPASPDPQADTKKVADAKFLALMTAMQVSTIADLESTFHTIGKCPPGYVCREANPLLRPFVQSGRPAAYAFTTGINSLVWWSSYRMKKRGNRWWWVGPTVQIAVHTVAAVHNYRTAARLPAGPQPVR
ncbi:MAG TPA: hypothetical protein VNQ79_14220 [Blastocatellia bacterium]|nr:hypothetical protein [Blastocatellia bacterium]